MLWQTTVLQSKAKAATKIKHHVIVAYRGRGNKYPNILILDQDTSGKWTGQNHTPAMETLSNIQQRGDWVDANDILDVMAKRKTQMFLIRNQALIIQFVATHFIYWLTYF